MIEWDDKKAAYFTFAEALNEKREALNETKLELAKQKSVIERVARHIAEQEKEIEALEHYVQMMYFDLWPKEKKEAPDD